MITIIILICTKIFYPELVPIYNTPTPIEMQKCASFQQQSMSSFIKMTYFILSQSILWSYVSGVD